MRSRRLEFDQALQFIVWPQHFIVVGLSFSCPTDTCPADRWHERKTGQFLLAFSAGIENLGAGTLNVVGSAIGARAPSVAGSVLPDPNTMPTYQRIFHADGTCDELESGR